MLEIKKDSHQAKDSKQFTLVDSFKAVALNYKIEKQPPEPKTCRYCGNKLYHEGLVMSGIIKHWSPHPQKCACNKAQEYWLKHEQDQKLKQIEARKLNERAAMKARIDKLIGYSGIKKRFLTRTFDTYKLNAENKQAFEIAKMYVDEFDKFAAKGTGLYLEGTNGTGKTHLAVAIAIQLINRGIPVICKTSIDLLDDVKKTFDNKDVSEREVLDIYKNVDLLIIDDLGKEQCTTWSMPVLYSILNDRYENMRPTIITTNDNEDMLIDKSSPKGDSTNIQAIISRLHETNIVVTMAWDDYRSLV